MKSTYEKEQDHMDTNNKNTLRETGRWLRIAALMLTTLGPIINALAARLRERAQALRETAEQLDLAEQSGNLTQEFAKRSSEATRSLAERGSKATQVIAERGSKATQAIAERSGKASQELVKRGGELTQEVKQRSRQATEKLAERDGTLWTIIGFAVGLTIASIAAYVLIRRRLQQQAEENEQIQLSNNSHLNIPSRYPKTGEGRPTGQEIHPASQSTSTVQVQPASAPVESAVAIAEPAPTEAERPANATLIGIVNTKRYYPVETPLDQLADSQEGPLDVVYFTSEEEAKEQGFAAASAS